MAGTILLADDSVTIQKVVELTFLDRDYTVRSVTNGDEALSALQGVPPDLVIADVHMPGASGYEVCRRAKERYRDLPVLLLVGTFEPFNEEEASACGSDGYLKKPFDSQELLRRVELLLGSRSDATARAPKAELPAAVHGESTGAPEIAPPVAATGPAESRPAAPGEAPSAPPVVPQPPAETAGSGESAVEKTVTNSLSDEQIEKIAHRVAELIGEKVVREVAWEVIPDLAEVVIKDRLRELEEQVEHL